MKRVALGIFLGLALSSPGFAIIRPPFPVKAAPPYNGRYIIIGDNAVGKAAAKVSR